MTLEDQSDVEQANGSCEGPDSMYVKLVSSDGHEFILKREYALISPTIAAMLSGPGEFNENETNKIRLLAISSHILQKVCAYLAYKAYYANGNPDGPVPGFPIEPEIALDLLMASCFLEC